jgi:hypothetical protein
MLRHLSGAIRDRRRRVWGRPEETRTAGIGGVRVFRRGRRAPATRLHRRLSDRSAKLRNVLFLFEACLLPCDGALADVRLQQTLERRAESSSPRGRLRGIDARRHERRACGPDRRACGFAHRDGRPCRLALGSDDGARRLDPEKLAAIVSRRGQSAPKASSLESREATFATASPGSLARGGFEVGELCEEATRTSIASEAPVSRIESSFALESAKLSKSRDGFSGNGASRRDRASNLLERARKRPFRDDSSDD